MKAAMAAALINFVWQGAAIGVLAWIGFSLARTPRVRYLVGIAALAAMALAPVATGVVFARAAEVPGPSSPVPGSRSSQVLGATSGRLDPGRGTEDVREPGTGDRGRWTLSSLPQLDPRLASMVLAVWLIGVGVLSARLAFGWLGARRLTRRVRTAGANVQAVANRLIAQLRIRAAVRVVESALVQVPSVVGAFKPVVLLPAAAMSGLSMEQVEALLAHELAHVRRHDYLVNLFQSAIETLLFYHPAVWLVSRRVRQERELCCDDLALEVCGDRVAYASALADLESLRAMPSPALAATGGSLLARVRRILGNDEMSALAGRSRSVAGIAILASILVLAGGQAARAKAEDARRAEWSASPAGALAQAGTPPQVSPPAKPTQGVVGGVVSGVRGGVVGGVTTGVGGGVQGGTPGGVVGGVKDTPSIPAPVESLQQAAVPDAYIVRLGDELRVFVSSPVAQAEFAARTYKVQPDGSISLPHLYEPVKIVGFTIKQTREAISAALINAKQFANPIVEVNLVGYKPSDLIIVSAEPMDDSTPPIAAGQIVRLECVVGMVRQSEFNKDYTVQPDGTIVVPYLGPTRAAGLTTKDLGGVIAGELNSTRTLPGAKVTASIETRQAAPPPPEPPKTIGVIVQGAVRSPGSMQLRADRMTISDAISNAGGFQSSAGYRIWVHGGPNRPKPDSSVAVDNRGEVFRKDDVLQGRLANTRVYDGDTITVEVAPHFYVTGYVKNSTSEYNWQPGMTLGKAIEMAGGLTPDGAGNRVEIQRKDPKTGKFAVVKLDKDTMSTPILGDDVVRVPKKRM